MQEEREIRNNKISAWERITYWIEWSRPGFPPGGDFDSEEALRLNEGWQDFNKSSGGGEVF